MYLVTKKIHIKLHFKLQKVTKGKIVKESSAIFVTSWNFLRYHDIKLYLSKIPTYNFHFNSRLNFHFLFSRSGNSFLRSGNSSKKNSHFSKVFFGRKILF